MYNKRVFPAVKLYVIFSIDQIISKILTIYSFEAKVRIYTKKIQMHKHIVPKSHSDKTLQ